MAAAPCGCGKPAGPTAEAASKRASSRAIRERGASFARRELNSSDKRRREGGQQQGGRAAEAGEAEAEDGGAEASHAGENREGIRGGCCAGSSDSSSRRITTSRSNPRKRTRSSTRDSGGIPPPPLCFPLLPAWKGGGVSAGIARILGAWFSRRRLAATIVAAVLAVASAQEEGGESGVADAAESVTVPLASAGLQYTADVLITNSSSVS